jgi:hypothetical protein
VGLKRARAQGIALGRPDGFERWAPMLKALKEKGYSQGAMSRETSLGFSTVKRYLRRLEEDA